MRKSRCWEVTTFFIIHHLSIIHKRKPQCIKTLRLSFIKYWRLLKLLFVAFAFILI